MKRKFCCLFSTFWMIHFIKAIILPSYVSVSGQKYIYKVGAEIQTHTCVSSYDEEVHVII